MSSKTRNIISLIVLLLVLLPLLAFTGWCAWNVHELSQQRADIKNDYSEVNNIKYGLLSVEVWKEHVEKIVSAQVEEFDLTAEQEKFLKQEISAMLNALIIQADSIVQAENKTLIGKIRKAAVNTLIKKDDIKKKIPQFTKTIMKEIEKPSNKEKLKEILRQKLEDYAAQTYDTATDLSHINKYLLKYRVADVAQFNKEVTTRLLSNQSKTYKFSYIILSIMAFFWIVWWIVRNRKPLHHTMFILSVLLAAMVLLVGLTSPMIEIDARIKKVDFHIIGEELQFSDQVLFFQSKSILQVVHILIATKKPDTMIVGILILAFSILFPFTKLISTEVYLLGSERIKKNKLVNFLAFKTGKWSMADVTVVAIFMAYIGFKGILENQLGYLTVKTEELASIATNQTSLQPGFLLFTAFVIYGLALSELLKRIEPGTDESIG